MDSPCIKQTVCKVLKIFQYAKYLVAYVFKKNRIISNMIVEFLASKYEVEINQFDRISKQEYLRPKSDWLKYINNVSFLYCGFYKGCVCILLDCGSLC